MRLGIVLLAVSIGMGVPSAGAEITQVSDTPAGRSVSIPSISGDGRYIAFGSDGNIANLNPVPIGNVFVYEVPTGLYTRLTSAGGDDPTISANGRYVAFSSSANYVRRNADESTEIFRYDRKRKAYRQITRDNLGDGSSAHPVVSGKGFQVTFETSSNIRRRNPDFSNEAGLYNRGGTGLITSDPDGSGESLTPTVSALGDFVVFQSSSDLVGKNADFSPELMLWDVKKRKLSQLTNDPDGNGESSSPAISGDSKYIAFISSSNIDGLNPDGASAVYLVNRPRHIFVVVTTSPDGVFDGDTPSLSDDGRYIVFTTAANVTAANADHNSEIVIHDRVRKTFTQVTTTTGCANSNPKISGDGSRIAFASNCDFTGANADGNVEAFVADNPLLNLEVHSEGPVSLTVRDPNDLTISRTANFIPRAAYSEGDFNGDTVPEDRVIIPQAIEGPYEVTVAPDTGAPPAAPVTLNAVLDGVTIPLTTDVAGNLAGAQFLFANQGFTLRSSKIVPINGTGSSLTLRARLKHVTPPTGAVKVRFTDSANEVTFDLGPLQNFPGSTSFRSFKGTVGGFLISMRLRIRSTGTTGISLSARGGDLSMFAGTGNASIVMIVQIGSDTTVYYWRFKRGATGNLTLK